MGGVQQTTVVTEQTQ
jgi:hypothetical protein